MQQNDSIIAINDKPLAGNAVAPPLILEKDYNIKEIYACKCGQEHFDVGLSSVYNYIRCYTCKEEIPRGDSIHWCHPSRFVSNTFKAL